MLCKFGLISAVAATLFLPSQAPAGSALNRGVIPGGYVYYGRTNSGVYQGSGSEFHTNPGGKYVHYGRTNPGGKYVYRGSGLKFHTNPGGKYVYPGYSSAPH